MPQRLKAGFLSSVTRNSYTGWNVSVTKCDERGAAKSLKKGPRHVIHVMIEPGTVLFFGRKLNISSILSFVNYHVFRLPTKYCNEDFMSYLGVI